jgi:hypothetical protein
MDPQNAGAGLSRVRAALDAVDRGWSVVPLHSVQGGRCSCGDPSCPAPGKHARIRWKQRMRQAAGPELVRRWWRRWPDANVGVVTGGVSGFVVLDIDPRNGGGDALAVLEGVHGLVPHTVESLTGGGGQHLYFRHPGIPVPCRPIAPGLDVKGDGGLVVSPPSTHVSGRPYVWERGCAPEETVLADLPWWIGAMAGDSAPKSREGIPTRTGVPIRTEGERSQFAALWAALGIALLPGDQTYLCPFHPDHHPSLHIDAEGCRFYCFGCGRGGGAGRLRRLVHTRRERAPRDDDGQHGPAHQARPAVTLPGSQEVKAVGESHYQDALLELTGGRRHYGGVRMETVATLVPERENPADPDAVSVRIGGRMVGFLSRPDARHYHAAIVSTRERSGEATCAAVIVGGWEREHGDVGLFGVRLRLGGLESDT